MIRVLAPAGPYRVAIAELPLSTSVADRAADAIVIVAGSPGWVDAALDAAAEGARAIVVADPVFVPSADVRRLAAATTIPVALERPMLRADVAGDAVDARNGMPSSATPRLLVLDGTGPQARVRDVLRDAVGWVRILTGEPPTFVGGHRAPTLLQTAAGIAATVSIVASSRPTGSIHAQVLGEVVTEVEVEGRTARVATVSAAGRLISPGRYESSERLAVRRAIVAVERGQRLDDLEQLAADTELVEKILAPSA